MATHTWHCSSVFTDIVSAAAAQCWPYHSMCWFQTPSGQGRGTGLSNTCTSLFVMALSVAKAENLCHAVFSKAVRNVLQLR